MRIVAMACCRGRAASNRAAWAPPSAHKKRPPLSCCPEEAATDRNAFVPVCTRRAGVERLIYRMLVRPTSTGFGRGRVAVHLTDSLVPEFYGYVALGRADTITRAGTYF